MYMRLLYYNNIGEKYLGLKKPLSLACNNLNIVFEKWSDNKASDWMSNYDIAVFHGEPYNKEGRYTIFDIMDPTLLSCDGLVVLYVSRAELPVMKKMIKFSDVETGLSGKRYALNILDTTGCGLTTDNKGAVKEWESLLNFLKDSSAMQRLLNNSLFVNGVLNVKRFFSIRSIVFLSSVCVICQKYLLVHFPNPLDTHGIIKEAFDVMGLTISIPEPTRSVLVQKVHESILGIEKPLRWQSILCDPQIKDINEQRNLLIQHLLEEWGSTTLPDEVSRLVDAVFSEKLMEDPELIASAFIVIAKCFGQDTVLYLNPTDAKL